MRQLSKWNKIENPQEILRTIFYIHLSKYILKLKKTNANFDHRQPIPSHPTQPVDEKVGVAEWFWKSSGQLPNLTNIYNPQEICVDNLCLHILVHMGIMFNVLKWHKLKGTSDQRPPYPITYISSHHNPAGALVVKLGAKPRKVTVRKRATFYPLQYYILNPCKTERQKEIKIP